MPGVSMANLARLREQVGMAASPEEPKGKGRFVSYS